MQSLETKDALLFVSAAEAAQILGIARRSLISRVEAGTVQAAHKLPGRTGAFLFDRAYIEQIAQEERRPALAAKKTDAAAPSSPADYAIQDQKTGVILLEARHVDLDGGGVS